LECGGLTPLSFFHERQVDMPRCLEKKESGVKPPHSKVPRRVIETDIGVESCIQP
jgi:hypothetical protein